MKILFLTNASSIEGNANLDIFTVSKELISRGHDVYIITQNDGNGLEYHICAGSMKVFPIIPKMPINYLKTPLLILDIIKLSKEIKPDILISDNEFNLPIITLFVSRALKIPLIWMLREMSLENFYAYYTNPMIRIISYLLYNLNYKILNCDKYLVAIDKKIQIFYNSALVRDDIRVINLLCLDIDRYRIKDEIISNLKRSMGLNPNDIVLEYNGSLDPYRRVDLLIEAFCRIRVKYPDAKLIISGRATNVNSKKELINKSEKLGLNGSVIFPDWLLADDMPKLISMADITVDTYPRQAMTPSCKLLEWMACGKCIVAPSNPGDYLIKDGFNGILYPRNEINVLAQKLEMLIAKKDLREFLGKNAFDTIKLEYDVHNVVSVFEQFCVKVIHDYSNR